MVKTQATFADSGMVPRSPRAASRMVKLFQTQGPEEQAAKQPDAKVQQVVKQRCELQPDHPENANDREHLEAGNGGVEGSLNPLHSLVRKFDQPRNMPDRERAVLQRIGDGVVGLVLQHPRPKARAHEQFGNAGPEIVAEMQPERDESDLRLPFG